MATTEQARVSHRGDSVWEGGLRNFLRTAVWQMAMAPGASITDAIASDKSAPTVNAVRASSDFNEIDRQISRLQSMRGALEGWAGPNSATPNEKSLDAAIQLLERLRYLPLPIPMASVGSHGNAGLFWSDRALYADVEFLEDGRIGYLLHLAGSDPVDSEDPLPDVGLPPLMAKALTKAYFSTND